MNTILIKKEDECNDAYVDRVVSLKRDLEITWDELKDIINEQTGYRRSADSYRKRAFFLRNGGTPVGQNPQEIKYDSNELFELKKERVKLSDERNQINALCRRISREDNIKEIALEAAKLIEVRLPLLNGGHFTNYSNEAILEISDWHYGVDIDSWCNKYNTELAVKRIAQLKDMTINYCSRHKIKTLYVVNLGDLIAGRIHLQLRINSRIDVITQIMEVSELLAQFLHELSGYVKIKYYDTLDNHSRLEPNIKDNIELETLARITTWYLKERLKNNNSIDINTENAYGDDIITFTTEKGVKVCGVHGDKDKQVKVIQNMCLMTQQHWDICLSAHLHHFSADEKNETVLISNGSLMGTDDYAQSLRLNSAPSQNLIILNDKTVECIYKINLD